MCTVMCEVVLFPFSVQFTEPTGRPGFSCWTTTGKQLDCDTGDGFAGVLVLIKRVGNGFLSCSACCMLIVPAG